MSRLLRHLFAATSLVLIFTAFYGSLLNAEWPQIFRRQLHWNDELINSVVSGNIYRQPFPAMLRLNSLVDEEGVNWRENPYWQHIPPLFAYVPLPFFIIDGRVTIEMERIAYATVQLLTGVVLIYGVYYVTKSFIAAAAATAAAALFVLSPMSRWLISGELFGASDIVLALAVTAAYVAIAHYLALPRPQRQRYAIGKLAAIAFIATVPLLVKNVLGATPAATLIILLAYDHRRFNKKVALSVSVIGGLCLLYYGTLWLTSPATFRSEFLVAWAHFGNYENWQQPWHYHLSTYLPSYYTGSAWPLFAGALIVGIPVLISAPLTRRQRVLLSVALAWYVWNHFVLALVSSKTPNFGYQAFLLAIFFSLYGLIAPLEYRLMRSGRLSAVLGRPPVQRFMLLGACAALGVSVFLASHNFAAAATRFRQIRHSPYPDTHKEAAWYRLAEYLQQQGADTSDLLITLPPQPPQRNWDYDAWHMRYYLMFLTGAESRTLKEVQALNPSLAELQQKYQRIIFIRQTRGSLTEITSAAVNQVTPDFQLVTINLTSLDPARNIHDLYQPLLETGAAGKN
jgi:hypothetical protein